MLDIVDFHVHVADRGHWSAGALQMIVRYGAANGWQRVVGEDGETIVPEAFQRFLAAEGVSRAVLIPSFLPGATEFVLDFAAPFPNLFAFAAIDPRAVGDLPAEVRRVAARGAVGIKLFPPYHGFYPNDQRLYPLYDEASRLGLMVMFHTGVSLYRESRLKYAQPLWLDDVAADFPALRIVIAHCGRGLWYEEAWQLAVIHPNIWLELSGIPPRQVLQHLPGLEKLADRVLFGSDWPVCPGISQNARALQDLPIAADNLVRILSRNALALLLGGAQT